MFLSELCVGLVGGRILRQKGMVKNSCLFYGIWDVQISKSDGMK